MRKLNLENGKFHLEDEIEAVVEGEVKKIGNGAMILSAKKGSVPQIVTFISPIE